MEEPRIETMGKEVWGGGRGWVYAAPNWERGENSIHKTAHKVVKDQRAAGL